MDDEERLEDLPVLAEARFLTTVRLLGYSRENCRKLVLVATLDKGDGGPEQELWALAGEYMIAVAAQKSSEGFERALDRMRESAREFRTVDTGREEMDDEEEDF